MIYGVGTEWCRMCGSNSTYGNVTQSDVSTCFLAYGGLAPSSDVNDTVFECACKHEYNGTGSNGITCNGEYSAL